ncbi:hypothetical protein FHS39_004274 [Streptomyces olivoverticillatus]|uniref:SCP2 domain-containing protein n=1 Tax=Streptomyces olivoverticillatus TaxID=66427 RepID=A0A7W7LSG2_9ACTN|nr:hypothetical protein [Streptomyces olivoverticillatus]MBB4895207.1 hypothetical protein [Streptomyces olivoverticillatus]
MAARTHDFRELRKLTEGRSAEEVEAAAVEACGGVDEVLDAVFTAYRDAFDPQRAGDAQGEFQFDVTTSAGTRQYTVAVGEGRCEARRGPGAPATAVTTVGLGNLLLMAAGEVTGFRLYGKKLLTTEGDLTAAIGFKDWFVFG